MKIPDTPSQVLNAPSHATNTSFQCRRHQVRQPKQQVHQPKHQIRPMLIYAIFVTNLRTFLAYNLDANKCGGVQKVGLVCCSTRSVVTRAISKPNPDADQDQHRLPFKETSRCCSLMPWLSSFIIMIYLESFTHCFPIKAGVYDILCFSS